MNGETRSCIDQILNAIEYGNLSSEEIERRVQKLYDTEVLKTHEPANMEMIAVCQSLLWELKTHGKFSYEDHSEKIRASIEKEYAAWTRRRCRQRVALKLGAAAAAIVLVLGANSFLHLGWFWGMSSPDGQQYIIQGYEINGDMIQSAIAKNQDVFQVSCEDAADLQGYLGFDPEIPQIVSKQFHLMECQVFFFPNMIQVNAYYGESENNVYSISYILNLYTDVDDALVSIEQNENGNYIVVDGQSMYLTTNIDYSIACWQTENSVHSLSISGMIQNVEEIITEFLGGK